MLEDIRDLLILQDRDRRLLTLAKDLERLPQEEARAKNKLAGDETAVAHAKEALQKVEIQLKNLELDAETRKTTIARLKNQQFETRKIEEYQALANEVTRYEKEVDALETRELELMETIDKLRSALKQADATLAHTKTLVNEDLESIRQRHQRMAADRDEVSEERSKLSAAIPDSILPLYERLLISKNGAALARMDNGKCDGCHMKLIPGTVAAVQSAKEIARCENCGRILYTEE